MSDDKKSKHSQHKTSNISRSEYSSLLPESITVDSIDVSPQIYDEIKCPICMNVLKRTMVTKECLHRFCYDCIRDALRKCGKNCPLCREKLISKRSLHPDTNYDFLISKIYPTDTVSSFHANSIHLSASDANATFAFTSPSTSNQGSACGTNNKRLIILLNRVQYKEPQIDNNNTNYRADDHDRAAAEAGNKSVPEFVPNEIKLVFKPLPRKPNEMDRTENTRDELVKALHMKMVKEQSVRHLKTIPNASGSYYVFLLKSHHHIEQNRRKSIRLICSAIQINAIFNLYN
jgi:hypothetical protein